MFVCCLFGALWLADCVVRSTELQWNWPLMEGVEAKILGRSSSHGYSAYFVEMERSIPISLAISVGIGIAKPKRVTM